MKKLVLAGLLSTFLFSSCAVQFGQLQGSLWTAAKTPVAATSAERGTKVGTSSAVSILGIFCVGDASIEAAAKKAGITKITHVDKKLRNILGIYGQYTVFVYGE